MTARRVLIVAPNFPPSSAPDSHRARLIAPHLQEFGWDAHVLAVDAASGSAPTDAWLAQGLPSALAVTRVQGLGQAWRRVPGLGSSGWRAWQALHAAASSLMERVGFDLAYFTTTAFETTTLGPRWKRRFGLPYVVDFQDPWVTDYYAQRPEVTPPGGRFKYKLAHGLSRRLEPGVVRESAGVTAVSKAYVDQLRARYGFAAVRDALVLPMPYAEQDVERLRRHRVENPVFDPVDGEIHWVYTGAVVPGMLLGIRALLTAARDGLPPEVLSRLRIHFIGTSYAPAGTAAPIVVPIARELGLANLVDERCDRIGYSQAIQCMLDADAILAFGSDDPAYRPSKIYNCLLARRPLLAVYAQASAAAELLARAGCCALVEVPAGADFNAVVDQIRRVWIDERGHAEVPALDRSALEDASSRASTGALCAFFDDCLQTASGAQP